MQIKFDKESIMRKVRSQVDSVLRSCAEDLKKDVVASLTRKSSNIMAVASGSGGASAPGSPPAMNTGALARSIAVSKKEGDQNHPGYEVGTNLIYSRIQEYGGRITAKKGKFLAIPVGADGRRAARDSGGNIRSLNLTLLKTKTGRMMLVKWLAKGQKAAKGSKAAAGNQYVILFVLKKTVILPARPYMRPAAIKFEPIIKGRVEATISRVLAEAS